MTSKIKQNKKTLPILRKKTANGDQAQDDSDVGRADKNFIVL